MQRRGHQRGSPNVTVYKAHPVVAPESFCPLSLTSRPRGGDGLKQEPSGSGPKHERDKQKTAHPKRTARPFRQKSPTVNQSFSDRPARAQSRSPCPSHATSGSSRLGHEATKRGSQLSHCYALQSRQCNIASTHQASSHRRAEHPSWAASHQFSHAPVRRSRPNLA